MFIFCDPFRLESQCCLSKHTGRVCSRCFTAGRSCLLPALCTPQGRTGAEGFSAFSGGRRSPRNRVWSWPRNFTQNLARNVSQNLCRNSPGNVGPVFTVPKISQSIFVSPWEKFHTPFWKFYLSWFCPPFCPGLSAVSNILLGLQVIHGADLQCLNALLRSNKVCTMLDGVGAYVL